MAGEKERGRENYFEGVREKCNYYENCFHRFIFSLDDRWREMKNEISTSLEGENIGLRNEHGEAEERERQRRERERDMVAGVREIPRSSEFLTRPCYTSNFQIESRRFVIPPSSVVR